MNSFSRGQRGFTLIELLVVIAIIGILSSVVIASLATARNKGADTAVKADLSSIRNQMELFYDTGNTYTGACTNPAIAAMLTSAGTASATGLTPACFVNTASPAGTAWAVSAPLKTQNLVTAGSSGQDHYCVDSVGAAKVITDAVTSSVCP